MTIFCRFDSERSPCTFKNSKLLMCVNQETRAFEGDEYEVFTLLINHQGRYKCVNNVLDFEVM